MSTQAATMFNTVTGETMPLRGVHARGRLQGLLFELEVEQTWENTGAINIEGEYTFPVPHRAVLLGLELELGVRRLKALATPVRHARDNYERAIDEGDSAALLERSGDGLYTLSLGNLMAGERAVIRYRYAELLDRSGDEVRMSVPTVIAPRFGDPAAHGLLPHQMPHTDLGVAYSFGITVDIVGDMSSATLESPSHSIRTEQTEEGCRVLLASEASLDRDFVLKASGPVTRAAAIVANDENEYVTLVSLDPGITETPPGPLQLKLLVDCSGSMGGDSIEAARRALSACIARLEHRDLVSLSRFGSHVEHLTDGLVAASEVAKAGLTRYLGGLQADLGGTALPQALAATIAIPGAIDVAPKDILLVTDAEVWALDAVVETAARSGHRLFVVAVGAAPAEALSRRLADSTGGACEFVAPGEDAEAGIVRMFRRLRETPKRILSVDWPTPPVWEAPRPTAVFSGDTLHLIAGFAEPPQGKIAVSVGGACEGAAESVRLTVSLSEASADLILPRLAAARRLTDMDESEATMLAERYQLASSYTSLVVVQVRDAEGKAAALPELRSVAQMLAAGWGGAGSVKASAVAADRSMSPPVYKMSLGPRESLRFEAAEFHDPADYADARRTGKPARTEWAAQVLHALVTELEGGEPMPEQWDRLTQLGVPDDIVRSLVAIATSEGLSPDRTIVLFIALLAMTDAGSQIELEARTQLVKQSPLERDTRDARYSIRGILTRCGLPIVSQRNVVESSVTHGGTGIGEVEI